MKTYSRGKVDLAICSNLAKPYGEIIDRLLSNFYFTRVLNYEVGYRKPDDGIYDAIVNQTGHSKNNTLFIGDTFLADVEGPRKYGFQSLHLDRKAATGGNSIQTLDDLFCLEIPNN
jgi:HAD superfamily hydrolase (TIGR01549 family)